MVLKDEILQPDILSLMRNSDIFNKKDICKCFHNSLPFVTCLFCAAIGQVRIFLLSGGKCA